MSRALLPSAIDFRNGSKEEEIFINCPFCLKIRGVVDEKFKLGVNLSNGLFNCFKCHANNKSHSLNILKGLEFQGENYSSFEELEEKLKNINKKEVRELDLDEFSTLISVSETPMAYMYMKEVRGFSDEMIDYHRVRVGKSFPRKTRKGKDYTFSKWRGRVIFPFFEEGVCKYAVGRTHVGDDPKYYNSLGGKGRFIFGLDRVKDKKAILCEGIISSIAAEDHTGITGLSVLGKSVSELQMTKIRTKVNILYLCLDGDVSIKDLAKLRVQAKNFQFKEIYEVKLPRDKDPDEMSKEDFLKCLDNSVKINNGLGV